MTLTSAWDGGIGFGSGRHSEIATTPGRTRGQSRATKPVIAMHLVLPQLVLPQLPPTARHDDGHIGDFEQPGAKDMRRAAFD